MTVRSGAQASGNLTGDMSFSVGGGMYLLAPSWTDFLWDCNENEALTLVLSGSSPAIGGGAWYDVVAAH